MRTTVIATSNKLSRFQFVAPIIVIATLALVPASFAGEDVDRELVSDLALYQGTWELLHGDGDNEPTTRSVKTVKHNKSTVRRYSIETGEILREHSSTFKLSKAGSVRVHTFFFGNGGGRGWSYVYKLDKDNFYEATGLLQTEDYRSHTKTPRLFHWKRISPSIKADAANASSDCK